MIEAARHVQPCIPWHSWQGRSRSSKKGKILRVHVLSTTLRFIHSIYLPAPHKSAIKAQALPDSRSRVRGTEAAP